MVKTSRVSSDVVRPGFLEIHWLLNLPLSLKVLNVKMLKSTVAPGLNGISHWDPDIVRDLVLNYGLPVSTIDFLWKGSRYPWSHCKEFHTPQANGSWDAWETKHLSSISGTGISNVRPSNSQQLCCNGNHCRQRRWWSLPGFAGFLRWQVAPYTD